MAFEVVSPTAALLDARYLLQDRVGQGGMGTVYRAEDTRLERVVAIKMIHPDDGAVDAIERAHTEKALLASLSHPNLVTLFDAQLDPDRPQYLVMEYVDGPTLAARMAHAPLPAREVAFLVRDIAEGLAAAHAAGIVHRDVKPSNVLLSRRTTRSGGAWTAKLADFGIAQRTDDPSTTTPGIVLGTLTYMAPERLRDADPGTPADVFSLGLVAIEALTGEAAYTPIGSGRAAAIARLAAPPEIPAHIEGEWRDLLERMTSLDPAERPTAAEVARSARRLVRGESAQRVVAPVAAVADAVDESSATKTAIRPVSADRRPRRRALAAGAAALAIGGFALVGAAALNGEDAGASSTVYDAVISAVTPVEAVDDGGAEQQTPDAVVSEPVVSEPVVDAPVTPVDPADSVGHDPAPASDDTASVGDDGNGNNGNGNNGNGRPDHAGKPGTGAKD
ncbi:serine/threonine-protein kinase [Microbacterium sp. NPDC008134]|uniref:serine/threonine-protein kinase n=1 Tax=Microbacterium sp. NPDC008134 TaxID=3364183 RepID=UPI0036E5F8D1